MTGTTEATQDPWGDKKSNQSGFHLLLALQVVWLLFFSFGGYNQRVQYQRLVQYDERIGRHDGRFDRHDERIGRQDELHLNTQKHIQSTTERFDSQVQRFNRQDELHGSAEGQIRKLENLLQASHARIEQLEQHVQSSNVEDLAALAPSSPTPTTRLSPRRL